MQFLVPGVPQVYYVGLLAGVNDRKLLKKTGVGRDISRHVYSTEEIHQELHRPVVRRLLGLIRLRNTHPAFGGRFELHETADEVLRLGWRRAAEFVRLEVNFATELAAIECSQDSRIGRIPLSGTA